MTATVAIIGRPNVGKSTLFNRLVGKRLALVDDTPGVTRDRREGEGRISDLEFRLIDTAGLEVGPEDSLQDRMWRQTESALLEADVGLMMIDARTGLTTADEHFADILRRSGTPLIPLMPTIICLPKTPHRANRDTRSISYIGRNSLGL